MLRMMQAATIAVAATCLAATTAAAMDGYKWKSRPVVVFAPSTDDPRLARQRGIVASLRPAFIDRNVVMVYVGGDVVTADLGPSPTLSASALRRRFGVASGEFKVLLVGKDGGVKLTSSEPFPAETVFRTIDAMPMRANEVRRGR
ncbi:MAG: DUF4174 domain-containing protein [Hyphomicrobiaceae bacterium]